MKVTAIVPVRALGEGKTRLAAVLSSERRTFLVQSMLQRVLAAVQDAELIDRILVVTPDNNLILPAGIELLQDQGVGLNAAVQLALDHLGLCTEAVLVVAADAPKVTAMEVDQLVRQAQKVSVLVVPDRHGQGTNGLWLKLPAKISPHYGVNSAAVHLHAAQAVGASALRLEIPGLAHDVDLPSDLDAEPLSTEQALLLPQGTDLTILLNRASERTLLGFGQRVSYSRKVFIPLTKLCRDVCHYCTFAAPPIRGAAAYLTPDEVLAIARAGALGGCHEALFTLGDKPELRYSSAREELATLGFNTTIEYLAHCAALVFKETGLLPHLNPGVMTRAEIKLLRPLSASMGIMLESSADRLSLRGAAHHRSPDKNPAVRLEMIRAAGELAVPFTTGILIGIGETRLEQIETLLAIRDLHLEFGHIQEVIVQNFKAKAGTRMALHSEPTLEDLQWTISAARLIFGSTMSIQAPPNLSAGSLSALIAAGVNDWGGVSPITPDYVNPEAPWPELFELEQQTYNAGRVLAQRLPLVPSFAREVNRWLDPNLRTAVRRLTDATGYVRETQWSAGASDLPLVRYIPQPIAAKITESELSPRIVEILDNFAKNKLANELDIVALFSADGRDYQAVVSAANDLRVRVVGEAVTYVVNRNINYTNICTYSCGFCAFAKGGSARSLRGPGYDLQFHEIAQRVTEAAQRGATEVCLQGGIHPKYTGETYLGIVRAAKEAAPGIHIHAFSPLEITHGAATLGLSIKEYLEQLKIAGLRTLPGTAAEILCDDIRQIICADKLNTKEWLHVMRTAHSVGLRSTATIMFGHVEGPEHWARHLLAIRALQVETGGFTEFVPLPFVHMEAPLWRRGLARNGPSFREAMLMHAVARLVLEPVIQNIQTSWVKMGREGALAALQAGANDLGGVLMNESITRAAGGKHGQEMDAPSMRAAISSIARLPQERTTLYCKPSLRIF